MGEAIVAGAAAVFRFAPCAGDPALLLQAVQGGKERAGLDAEDAAGGLLDPAGDAEAVHGFEREGFQDQQGEGALQQVGLGRGHGGSPIDSR